jgi:hypothetical protein
MFEELGWKSVVITVLVIAAIVIGILRSRGKKATGVKTSLGYDDKK